MAAKNQNFEMDSGDSHFLVITVYKEDENGDIVIDPQTGEPVIEDLTGTKEIEWFLRKKEDDTTYLVTKMMSTGGISLSNPSSGEFTVQLDPLDTQPLKFTYFHKARITDTNGYVSTVTKGTIRINP